MNDMTPEQLIQELQEAGFEKAPYPEHKAVMNMTEDPAKGWLHEIVVPYKIDEWPQNIMWEQALKTAEPFLKAHRADKALEWIEIQSKNSEQNKLTEFGSGFVFANGQIQKMLRGEE